MPIHNIIGLASIFCIKARALSKKEDIPMALANLTS